MSSLPPPHRLTLSLAPAKGPQRRPSASRRIRSSRHSQKFPRKLLIPPRVSRRGSLPMVGQEAKASNRERAHDIFRPRARSRAFAAAAEDIDPSITIPALAPKGLLGYRFETTLLGHYLAGLVAEAPGSVIRQYVSFRAKARCRSVSIGFRSDRPPPRANSLVVVGSSPEPFVPSSPFFQFSSAAKLRLTIPLVELAGSVGVRSATSTPAVPDDDSRPFCWLMPRYSRIRSSRHGTFGSLPRSSQGNFFSFTSLTPLPRSSLRSAYGASSGGVGNKLPPVPHTRVAPFYVTLRVTVLRRPLREACSSRSLVVRPGGR